MGVINDDVDDEDKGNDFRVTPAKNTVINDANTYDSIAHITVNNQKGNTV